MSKIRQDGIVLGFERAKKILLCREIPFDIFHWYDNDRQLLDYWNKVVRLAPLHSNSIAHLKASIQERPEAGY